MRQKATVKQNTAKPPIACIECAKAAQKVAMYEIKGKDTINAAKVVTCFTCRGKGSPLCNGKTGQALRDTYHMYA